MLSKLDERSIYDLNYFVVETKNEKVIVENSKGEKRECIDLISAYGACNFGHNNPYISKCLEDIKADICASFYPKEASDFSNWIHRKLELKKFESLIQVGGSFAVSTAISLAQHKKQGKVVHLNGAFHGLGLDSLSITVAQKEMSLQKNGFLNDIKNHFICLNVEAEDYKKINWSNVSSFIFEPIQGANGYIPVNSEWIKKVIKHVRPYGVTIIADEIQCGYYRHGEFSISKANGYDPDIYLFSKSLTNGIFPYSLVLYRDTLKNNLKKTAYLSHTFQTSSIGCYAMKAVADYIDNYPIEDYCNAINKIILVYKEKLESFHFISEINILKTTISFTVSNFEAKEIVKSCFQHNILIFTGGIKGNRIRIAPPITISTNKLKEALDIVLECINKIEKRVSIQ